MQNCFAKTDVTYYWRKHEVYPNPDGLLCGICCYTIYKANGLPNPNFLFFFISNDSNVLIMMCCYSPKTISQNEGCVLCCIVQVKCIRTSLNFSWTIVYQHWRGSWYARLLMKLFVRIFTHQWFNITITATHSICINVYIRYVFL